MSIPCSPVHLEKTLERELIVNETKGFSDIEGLSRMEISKSPDVPQVPFGYMNEKWQAFKMKYNKGDCLVHFTTSEAAWKRLAGLEGYAILRGKKVIDVFVVRIN
jgi:hypothetical protein